MSFMFIGMPLCQLPNLNSNVIMLFAVASGFTLVHLSPSKSQDIASSGTLRGLSGPSVSTLHVLLTGIKSPVKGSLVIAGSYSVSKILEL